MRRSFIFYFLLVGFWGLEGLRAAPDAKGYARPLKVTGTELDTLLSEITQKSELKFNHSNAEGKSDRTLVNLWATWCPPCLEEMPDLNRLCQHQRNNSRDKRMRVVLLSQDDKQEDLQSFMKKQGASFACEVVWDKSKRFSDATGTQKFPESFLFKSSSSQVRRFLGIQDWLSANIQQLLWRF